jgi:hypothetical protein
MPILGNKGKKKLDDMQRDLKKRIENSKRWKEAMKIPDLKGAKLEIEVEYEVVPISVSDVIEERIECAAPPPCYCVKVCWLQTYRVDYSIYAFLVHPNIIGYDPRVEGNGLVKGRNYEAMLCGYFTIRDEIVIETEIRCPEGFFDLIKDPHIVSLDPRELFDTIAMHVGSVRFVMLGVIEPYWSTLYMPVESISKDVFKEEPYTMERASMVTKTEMEKPVEITKEEALVYNKIDQKIGEYLPRLMASLYPECRD